MSSLFILFLGIVIGWLLRDIVDDRYKRRSYEWLIEHYLSDPELFAKADASQLAIIEMNGGCDKGTFRRLIMRPLIEKHQ